MKKYIEPKTSCVEIEMESLIADSPKGGMQNGNNLNNNTTSGSQLVNEERGWASGW